MARTYAVVEIDEDARPPKGWKLLRFSSPSASSKLIKKLRERGFYANHGNVYELEQACVRLSKISDAEASTKSIDASLPSKESFSDTKNYQTEQAVQSSPSKRAEEADDANACRDQHTRKPLLKPCSPCIGSLEDSIVNDWYLSVENEETVPITDAPYADSDLSCTERAFLLGFVSKEKEQLCIAVEEWKLDVTAEGKLAIYVKTTKKVWAQLGKPEKVYEQTIRSLLVYMQLFSMPVVEPEATKARVLQYLTSKFRDWKVKPNVSDLRESWTLMKKLNLGCLFPLERRVLSSVTIEAADVGEWDADSGGTPYTFKRIRRHTTAEPHATEVHGENILNSGLLKRRRASSPDRNEESPTSKRQTRSGKAMLTTAKKDHEQREVLSPNRSNSDHVLLSSKLNDLKKKRKANPQTGEAGDRIPKQDKQENSHESNEGFATSILKVESTSKREASASALPPYDDQRLETSHDSDQAGGKLELDNIKSRVLKIMRESTVDAQRGAKRGSEHVYSAEPLPSIRKLWDSTNAARRALDCLDKGGTLDEAQVICSRESLMNFSGNEAALHEYGVSQLLPPVNKQKEIAERINYYAHDGDTVVEICSQAVDYLSLLQERLTNLGKLCCYKRYMIDESQSVGVKEWMKSEGLPTGSKLLICLSLSFALWGEQANKILDYALELKPKLIVLIAPLFNRRLEEHTSYNLVWDDAELLQTEILWPWEVMEVPSAALDKKKGASPTVFVWSRIDWTTKHRQIASRFGHLRKPVSSGGKG